MINVNEKDTLTDLLMQEKDILKVYATFILEGSCQKLRDILQSNMEIIAKQQFEVFQMMQAKGLYQVKNAEAQAINQAKQMYASE